MNSGDNSTCTAGKVCYVSEVVTEAHAPRYSPNYWVTVQPLSANEALKLLADNRGKIRYAEFDFGRAVDLDNGTLAKAQKTCAEFEARNPAEAKKRASYPGY